MLFPGRIMPGRIEGKSMSKNMLDGGQVIVDYLVREKVPYAFGLGGHGNIGFIDALYERRDDIKTISVHHETVPGFLAVVYDRRDDITICPDPDETARAVMAEVNNRAGGKPTAAFSSCGPGAANLPIAL